jgi:MtaA/CmuA family methyltransferase
MNSKQRCLNVIDGKPVDRIPVFPLLMFLAQDRLGISYREYATNGRALAEAQLNIREKFPVDAITSCSDAFRITADLGAEMVYPENKTPYAASPLIRSEKDLKKIKKADPGDKNTRMADRVLGTKIMAEAAGEEILVLGWIDMPFAEACSVCGVSEFMTMLIMEPRLAHNILAFLSDIVINFAIAQVEAGAPMIGAGDATASMLSPDLYRDFALPYEKKVVDAIHAGNALVKLHICGNTSLLMQDMITTGADLFNVDHLVPFSRACEIYGKNNICFKGNLDPVAEIMQASPEQCAQSCLNCLEEAKGLRYMLSAGCEVPAETPDEVFQAFCEAPQK